MPVSIVTFFAFQIAVGFMQLSQGNIDPPPVVTIRLQSEDAVTFRLSQRVVTSIDLDVSGEHYSVALDCAGGLHDVHFDTSEIHAFRVDPANARGTFALFFDIGTEQDRKFGKLPRVQISFYRGQVREMLLTNMTGERSSFTSKLCPNPPIDPVACKEARQLQGLTPEALVQQLRDLPTPLPSGMKAVFSDAEKKRRSIYEELLDWGGKSIPSLVAALSDPDVRLRRNVALAFGVLSGGWWQFECGPAKLDIRPALPALATAFRDPDSSVRAWTAQAVGNMGANARDAVPALIGLLESADAGSAMSACGALAHIGPAARAALPALRGALSDQSPDVRRCAKGAIERIER